jgi:hypothetical protein
VGKVNRVGTGYGLLHKTNATSIQNNMIEILYLMGYFTAGQPQETGHFVVTVLQTG